MASQPLHGHARFRRSLAGIVAALAAFCILGGASASADWRKAPVVPALDGSTSKHIVKRLSSGQARANVFAKAGDSISYAETFLQGFGCGSLELGRYAGLKETVDFFRQRRLSTGVTPGFCERENSFSRESVATRSGKTSLWPMEEPSVLEQELNATRPGWLLVMFGTNDARDAHTAEQYRDAMNAIITKSQARGAVPILYTVPPRLDDPVLNQRVEIYNSVLYQLSRSRHVPLINFWRAMQQPTMVNRGLIGDGVHLGVLDVVYDQLGYVLGGTSGWVSSHNATALTQEGLSYGANLRNLITLQTLKRAMRVVQAR